AASAESRRHESDRLDAYVHALGQPGVDELARSALRRERPDGPAQFVRGDEVTAEGSKGRWRNRDATFNNWGCLRNHLDGAGAIDREQFGFAVDGCGDQKPVIERPDVVECNPIENGHIQIRERARLVAAPA